MRPYYGRAFVLRIVELAKQRAKLKARIREIDAELQRSGISKSTAKNWATHELSLRRVGLELDR